MENSNKDRLIRIRKSQVRKQIKVNGIWQGVVKMSDNHFRIATLTNLASLNNPNLLEFYITLSL